MAFIKYDSTKIGDIVKTTIKHANGAGYFEEGTIVKIIDITNRGYDIEDEEGNKILEIGWVI